MESNLKYNFVVLYFTYCRAYRSCSRWVVFWYFLWKIMSTLLYPTLVLKVRLLAFSLHLFLGKEKNVSHRKRCANQTFFCLHTRITGTTYTNYRDHIQLFVGPGKSTSDLPGPHTQVSILPTYRDHVEIIANTFECCFLCLFEVKSTFTMKTNEKK